MRTIGLLLAIPVSLALLFSVSPAADQTKAAGEDISWKKTVLDKVFRSEGVAVADVNNDGKMDILNGEVWYEAPDWKMHEIRKQGNYGNGQHSYSNSFCCWTEDLNGDGYPDLIVIPFPGNQCFWFENPKGKLVHWKAHEIWHSACNETPQYVDLLGTGKRVLIMGWQPRGKENQGQMAYFTPGNDPTKPWEMHPISEPTPVSYVLTAASLKALAGDKVPAEVCGKLDPLKDKNFQSEKELLTEAGKLLSEEELKANRAKIGQRGTHARSIPGTFKFSHGLGVGDINGDGRLDVVCTDGWWEQPEKPDGKTPWKFHRANLGEACADMIAYDVNGDGKADIISSSAHRFGIWVHEQRGGKGGESGFVRRDLFRELLSETHAMVCADINGDGLKDLVTGKRWWSHGRNEPGADWPAMLYWFEASKGRNGMITFTPRVIDIDSGIGTQFAVADVNGDKLLDVVVSNKKGTFLFEQVRGKK